MQGCDLVTTGPVANDAPHAPATRREELFAFIFLAVLIWPILAVGVVGGYGFLVWMYQLIAGPPGPPH
jgi:nitrate reductase NapE